MLTLPIKKKWLDMIISGKKKEEYREIKAFYHIRLHKFLKNKDIIDIKFRNGYSSESPFVICKCRIKSGTGKTEWGAIENKTYYILEILEIKK